MFSDHKTTPGMEIESTHGDRKYAATQVKKIAMIGKILPEHAPAIQGIDPKRELRSNIRQLLITDAELRKPGNLGPIYTIDQLAPFSRLKHGIPTLRNRANLVLDRTIDRVGTNIQYRDRLYMHAPFLKDFDIRGRGIVLAGGAAAGVLMRQEKLYHDFDFFLVGHGADNEAMMAISQFGDHLHQWHAKLWADYHIGTDGGAAVDKSVSREPSPMLVCRTRGCITFVLPTPMESKKSIQIQLILRRYDYLCEVIRGFDMGSSAVAWDGSQVFLTGLGKFAAEHGANILNLVVRRNSYERRLVRYFDRGYDLVLPNLGQSFKGCSFLNYMSVDGFDADPCCLCHLEVASLISVGPNDIVSHSILDEESDTNQVGWVGDRSMYENGSVNYTSAESVNKSNTDALVRALRTGGTTYAQNWLCACEKYTPGLSFAAMMPIFDREMWLNYIASKCSDVSRIELHTLKRLLGEDTALAIIKMQLSHGGHYMWVGSKEMWRILNSTCDKRFRELQSLIVSIPLEFQGVTDATSLCGDSVLSPEEWYGMHFAAN
jgi:hypothetical protein